MQQTKRHTARVLVAMCLVAACGRSGFESQSSVDLPDLVSNRVASFSSDSEDWVEVPDSELSLGALPAGSHWLVLGSSHATWIDGLGSYPVELRLVVDGREVSFIAPPLGGVTSLIWPILHLVDSAGGNVVAELRVAGGTVTIHDLELAALPLGPNADVQATHEGPELLGPTAAGDVVTAATLDVEPGTGGVYIVLASMEATEDPGVATVAGHLSVGESGLRWPEEPSASFQHHLGTWVPFFLARSIYLDTATRMKWLFHADGTVGSQVNNRRIIAFRADSLSSYETTQQDAAVELSEAPDSLIVALDAGVVPFGQQRVVVQSQLAWVPGEPPTTPEMSASFLAPADEEIRFEQRTADSKTQLPIAIVRRATAGQELNLANRAWTSTGGVFVSESVIHVLGEAR